MRLVPFFYPRLLSCLVAVLLLLSCRGIALAQQDSTEVGDGRFPGISQPQFRLMERVTFPGELVLDAAWLDERHYLCLTASANGAQVYMCNYETGEHSLFISPEFFDQYVCRFPDSFSLFMKISPAQHYLFLHWSDASGAYQWRLLDISDPPFFVNHAFAAPGGMQINDVLFSAADRFAIFTNDSFREGSDISMLVVDLESGEEAWRISTHDLSFVRRIWWDTAEDSKLCYASADLHNGEFRELPGLAILDLDHHSLSFDEQRSGLLMGDSADWGVIGCYLSIDKEGVPYYIRAQIPGEGNNMQVPLSDAPLDLGCLEQRGLILLRNTVNYSVSQLWLIDLISGDKLLVSRDCEHFEIGPDGRLLVLPPGNSELLVMQLFLPDAVLVQK